MRGLPPGHPPVWPDLRVIDAIPGTSVGHRYVIAVTRALQRSGERTVPGSGRLNHSPAIPSSSRSRAKAPAPDKSIFMLVVRLLAGMMHRPA